VVPISQQVSIKLTTVHTVIVGIIVNCWIAAAISITVKGSTLLWPVDWGAVCRNIHAHDAASRYVSLWSNFKIIVADIVNRCGSTILFGVYCPPHWVPFCINFTACFHVLGFPSNLLSFLRTCVLLTSTIQLLILLVLVSFIVQAYLLVLLANLDQILR